MSIRKTIQDTLALVELLNSEQRDAEGNIRVSEFPAEKIETLQSLIGSSVDGEWGPGTSNALEKALLGETIDGNLDTISLTLLAEYEAARAYALALYPRWSGDILTHGVEQQSIASETEVSKSHKFLAEWYNKELFGPLKPDVINILRTENGNDPKSDIFSEYEREQLITYYSDFIAPEILALDDPRDAIKQTYGITVKSLEPTGYLNWGSALTAKGLYEKQVASAESNYKPDMFLISPVQLNLSSPGPIPIFSEDGSRVTQFTSVDMFVNGLHPLSRAPFQEAWKEYVTTIQLGLIAEGVTAHGAGLRYEDALDAQGELGTINDATLEALLQWQMAHKEASPLRGKPLPLSTDMYDELADIGKTLPYSPSVLAELVAARRVIDEDSERIANDEGLWGIPHLLKDRAMADRQADIENASQDFMDIILASRDAGFSPRYAEPLSSDELTLVQNQLRALGNNAEEGLYRADTMAAMRAINPNGTLDDATRTAIRLFERDELFLEEASIPETGLDNALTVERINRRFEETRFYTLAQSEVAGGPLIYDNDGPGMESGGRRLMGNGVLANVTYGENARTTADRDLSFRVMNTFLALEEPDVYAMGVKATNIYRDAVEQARVMGYLLDTNQSNLSEYEQNFPYTYSMLDTLEERNAFRDRYRQWKDDGEAYPLEVALAGEIAHLMHDNYENSKRAHSGFKIDANQPDARPNSNDFVLGWRRVAEAFAGHVLDERDIRIRKSGIGPADTSATALQFQVRNYMLDQMADEGNTRLGLHASHILEMIYPKSETGGELTNAEEDHIRLHMPDLAILHTRMRKEGRTVTSITRGTENTGDTDIVETIVFTFTGNETLSVPVGDYMRKGLISIDYELHERLDEGTPTINAQIESGQHRLVLSAEGLYERLASVENITAYGKNTKTLDNETTTLERFDLGSQLDTNALRERLPSQMLDYMQQLDEAERVVAASMQKEAIRLEGDIALEDIQRQPASLPQISASSINTSALP